MVASVEISQSGDRDVSRNVLDSGGSEYTAAQRGLIRQAVGAAGDDGFLLGQRPGTNPARQRGFPVPTDKPTLIVSSRALSSADKREWKEITTPHGTARRPSVRLTLGLRLLHFLHIRF